MTRMTWIKTSCRKYIPFSCAVVQSIVSVTICNVAGTCGDCLWAICSWAHGFVQSLFHNSTWIVFTGARIGQQNTVPVLYGMPIRSSMISSWLQQVGCLFCFSIVVWIGLWRPTFGFVHLLGDAALCCVSFKLTQRLAWSSEFTRCSDANTVPLCIIMIVVAEYTASLLKPKAGRFLAEFLNVEISACYSTFIGKTYFLCERHK